MPRYTYFCHDCNSTLFFLLPSLMSTKVIKKQKVGDVVKQGIKKNQEILEQHKKESRKDYDA